MFYSHSSGGLGAGHVTERRAVAFVASAIGRERKKES